jgi:hypothetical protein
MVVQAADDLFDPVPMETVANPSTFPDQVPDPDAEEVSTHLSQINRDDPDIAVHDVANPERDLLSIAVPDPVNFPAIESEPAAEFVAPAELSLSPIAASLAAYDRSTTARQETPPALDPISEYLEDDDLPAWNAPRPQPPPSELIAQPSVAAPPEELAHPPISSPRRTAPGPAGFQSSLLADLDGVESPGEGSSGFQSSLLRDLTRESPSPGSGLDVLLEEFPMPERTEGRSSGKSSGTQ